MNSPETSGFERDLGPDADNYLQDLTPPQGSLVMYKYFYDIDPTEKSDNCDKSTKTNAKGETTK